MQYDFLSPGRIVFGWGRRREVGPLARSLGRRAFLVVGSRSLERLGVVDEISALLRGSGVEPVPLATVTREPEIEDVDAAVASVRAMTANSDEGDRLILALGGGSAIDLAKALAALAPQPSDAGVIEYLEGVGTGRQLTADPWPVLAMPTTSGTGSEATKNAVISSSARGFKKSLRSDRMIPRIALVDPELTVNVPADVTAATGMDAITQLIEAYMSRRAQPIPRALCLQGLELAAPSIVEAYRNPTSQTARENLSHAALLSGLALANSGLGMAHGVAAALGIHCGIAHGLACAVMLPAAMRTNAVVGRADLLRLSPLLTGRVYRPDEVAVSAAIEQVEEWNRQLGIPAKLFAFGVTRSQLPELVKASRGNSMSGNPRDLSDDEMLRILEELL